MAGGGESLCEVGVLNDLSGAEGVALTRGGEDDRDTACRGGLCAPSVVVLAVGGDGVRDAGLVVSGQRGAERGRPVLLEVLIKAPDSARHVGANIESVSANDSCSVGSDCVASLSVSSAHAVGIVEHVENVEKIENVFSDGMVTNEVAVERVACTMLLGDVECTSDREAGMGDAGARCRLAPRGQIPVEREPVTAPGLNVDNSDWFRLVAPSLERERVEQLYCTLRVADLQEKGRVELVIDVFMDCIRGVCSCVFSIEGAPAQLRPCRMFAECFCRGDVDPDWDYVLRGVCFGYRVIDAECSSSYSCSNYSSITKSPIGDTMSARLQLEIAEGLVTIVEQECVCTHALGSVPKGRDDFRAIVDCSNPAGVCVNAHTWSCRSKFSYNSVDSVTDFLQQDDALATVDISNAYRAVNTHPDSRARQGLRWDFGDGVVCMRDNRLCMGLSSSPYVFSKISDFVVRCLVREGFNCCVNYLDDFCLVGRDVEACREAQRALVAILGRIGFFVSFKKLSPAAGVTKFLGIEIDSVKMELRLPADKLKKLQIQLEKFIRKRKASKVELESLGGILAHCCKVVHGGRTFSRRIYDLMASARRNHHKVRLNEEFREDLRWWLEFAAVFNGHARIIPTRAPAVSVYSDASMSGFGALHGSDWVAGYFGFRQVNGVVELGHHWAGASDPGCATDNINVLEMWPILVGVRRWASGWRDKLVVFVTDNTQVCAALNTGRSKNKTTMCWLRLIFWESVKHNFRVKSVYINTNDNVICDSLSRLDCYKNIARVRDADVAKHLCCHHIFNC